MKFIKNPTVMVLFFSIAFTVLFSCEDPNKKSDQDGDYRDETETVPMFAVNTEMFTSNVGDSAVTILLGDGAFTLAPSLDMFAIGGGGNTLEGGAVTCSGPSQVTITGISVTVSRVQSISIAAAAQQAQISYAVAVSVKPADLTAADAFKAAHAAALALSVDAATAADESDVNAAIEAYMALTKEQKSLLSTEFEKLLSLNAKINDRLDSERAPYTNPVRKIISSDWSSNTATVNLSDLAGHSVYLVQVNPSPTPLPSTSSITATSTGGTPSNPFPSIPGYMNNIKGGSLSGFHNEDSYIVEQEEGDVYTVSGDKVERRDSGHLQRFIDNPLPANLIAKGAPGAGEFTFDNSATGTLYSMQTGDKKTFWTQKANGAWQEISATLQDWNDECTVWVANANYDGSSASNNDNKINKVQAQAVAKKFSEIYKLETNVFGFEYGGGNIPTNHPVYGGVDKDRKVQILIYDIDYDYTDTQTGGIMGFVNFFDEFSQAVLDDASAGVKTNLAEMIYIDAHFVDRFPQTAYSTVVHEFQHLICFNQKVVQGRTAMFSTWYGEMMAQLAEDLISPMIGIPITDNGHPVMLRFPLFLATYDQIPVMGWGSNNDTMLMTYSSVYAWGAYLARNFGGPDFVKKMATNGYVDLDSISYALIGKGTVLSAFNKFPEAFVYTGSQHSSLASFDKAASSTINGVKYTYQAFNIRKIKNYAAGLTTGIPETDRLPSFYRGAWIKNAGNHYPIAAQSAIVQSLPAWQRVTGDLTITLTRPTGSSVETYIMVR